MPLRDRLDPEVAPRTTHPGLILGPCFPLRTGGGRAEGARATFERAASDSASRGATAHAAKRLGRLRADLEAAGCAVAAFRMTTATRLVTGVGAGLPEVNATLVDRVYGFPYLPGSSLKGAARAEAERQGAGALAEIFGGPPESEGDPGSVRFFAALPVSQLDPLLELDTTTVHHKQYYEGHGSPSPTGAPVPVPILVVPARREFRFLLAGRDQRVGAVLVATAGDLLTTALVEEGFGGATSAGYGYFDDRSLVIE